MLPIADCFISVFIGMYLEQFRYWSTLDPDCTGSFVVCLPWDSLLTEIDTRAMGDSRLEFISLFGRSNQRL